MSTIKLLWDFRGPGAKGTAEHHVIHLNEFATRENIENRGAGTTEHSEVFWSAWLCVPEADMLKVRDALKPHRGQRVADASS